MQTKKIGPFLYKFHGVQFLARRCIIHGNSRTLTHDNSPLLVLSSVTPTAVRCASSGRLGALTEDKGGLAVEIRNVATWLDERRRSPAQRKNNGVIVRADARSYFLSALSWLPRIISCAHITAKNDISQVNYRVASNIVLICIMEKMA